MKAAAADTIAPDRSALERLAVLGTATIASQLSKRGIRNCWVRGAKPLLGTGRVVGPAYTLRFIAGREDLITADRFSRGGNYMEAIDKAPPGSIVVIDAQRDPVAGTVGDVLGERLHVLGVRGLVTDGVVRDLPGLQRVGLPVWAQGAAAPAMEAGLCFVGAQEPISCGGVGLFPGDILAADADGVVVVPPHLVAEIAEAGSAQEGLEQFIQARVREGRPLAGLYPPSAATEREYRAALEGSGS
jgi:regulator of RNase E activity RraA